MKKPRKKDAKPLNDWREYQVMVDGDERPIESLSLDELRLALCQAIDTIEDLDRMMCDFAERIGRWRDGRTPAAGRK